MQCRCPARSRPVGSSASSPSRRARAGRRHPRGRPARGWRPSPARDRGRRARCGHERAQTLERREIRVDGAAAVQRRDLERREVVADHQHARPPDRDSHPVDACGRRPGAARARARRSHSARAPAAPAPSRARADAARSIISSSSNARSSRWASPGAARRRSAVLSAQPSASPGKRQAPEQVIPVAVRREQPARRREAAPARAAPAARRARRAAPASRSRNASPAGSARSARTTTQLTCSTALVTTITSRWSETARTRERPL